MAEQVFADYGIVLFKRDDRFFVRYDGGQLILQMDEYEVSEPQAVRLQQGEQAAYGVLLEVERGRGDAAI